MLEVSSKASSARITGSFFKLPNVFSSGTLMSSLSILLVASVNAVVLTTFTKQSFQRLFSSRGMKKGCSVIFSSDEPGDCSLKQAL